MGCFCSKNVRCIKCNKRCDDVQLWNNICSECIRDEQKLREYEHRLAALRDDSATTGSTSAPAKRIITANIPRSNAAVQRRYIATRKSITTRQRRKSNAARQANTKALYGEYKCSCGRLWKSYRSWRNFYQKCKRCNQSVFPSLQRELLESEKSFAKLEEVQKHPEHLCGKCLSLGHHCNKR